MKTLVRILSCLAAFSILVTGSGCQRFEQAANKNLQEVRVAPVTEGDLGEYLTFVGTLRARKRATVSSAMGGTVSRVNGAVGDSVTAGQPLVWLETRDTEAKLREQEAAIEGARAHVYELQATLASSESKANNALRQAEQELRQAEVNVSYVQTQIGANKRDYQRLQTLYKQKAVSRSQMEQAELKYKLSLDDLRTSQSKRSAALAQLTLARNGEHDIDAQRAQVAGARAQLAQAEASANTVRVTLQESVLRAPLSGTIVDRNVEPGQAVGGGGTPLLTVVDNRELECVTNVEERYADRLRPHMEALLTTPIARDRRLKAEVVDLVPSSDPKTNTMRMRLRITNPDNLLMDGLSINGRITLSTHKGTLISREAMHSEGRKAYVMVVQGQAVKRREVQVQYMNETHVLVTGVAAGEFVVIEGSNLTDGQQVSIDYTPPSPAPSASALPEQRPKKP